MIVSDKKILEQYDVISDHLGDWTDKKGRNMVSEVYNNSNGFIQIEREITELQSQADNFDALCNAAMQIGD